MNQSSLKSQNLINLFILIQVSFLVSLLFVFPFPIFNTQPFDKFLTESYVGRGDITEYLEMANGNFNVLPPHRYRILVPGIVLFLSNLFTAAEPINIFLFINSIFLIVASLLLYDYLKNFNFTLNESFLGGILFLLSTVILRTSSFGLLEPATYFFTILGFWAMKKENYKTFAISLILGMLVKELLIFMVLVFFLNYNWSKKIKNISIPIIIAFSGVTVFVILRLLAGNAPFEVNYGYNPLAGEFPTYITRIFTPIGLVGWMYLVFATFGFLWCGITQVWRDRFLLKASISIPLVIFVQLILSSAVERIIFVTFPIIIPSFIYYYRILVINDVLLPLANYQNQLLRRIPKVFKTKLIQFSTWINNNSVKIAWTLMIITGIHQSYFLVQKLLGF